MRFGMRGSIGRKLDVRVGLDTRCKDLTEFYKTFHNFLKYMYG